LDDATGLTVFLKCENLQRAGAFKIRGALNKLLMLSADDRRRGVVAFSSGNHAQGVALAARMTDTTAIICMPSDAPKLKLEATRRYGAEVVFYDRQRDDREADGRPRALPGRSVARCAVDAGRRRRAHGRLRHRGADALSRHPDLRRRDGH